MDQEKIGKFILEVRKQKGLTQKELAEKVGISDKTISKWECGNSMPDISYLESLCNSLDISVNELLSGQCLSDESYSEKAEENIMALMKENESNKKGNVTPVIFGIALAGAAFVILIFTHGPGMVVLGHYFDFVVALVLALLCAAMVLLSGKKTKQGILSCLQRIVIPNGVLLMLFEFIAVMASLDDPSALGPRVGVCILTLLYAVAAYLVIAVMRAREERE